jgi:hypothetical protein
MVAFDIAKKANSIPIDKAMPRRIMSGIEASASGSTLTFLSPV